jgi:hypothetical protein
LGTNSIDHFHFHAHGLRNDENVGEDDCGVDEAIVSVDRLKGQGRGDFWRAAAFEEVTISLCFVVFRKVAASLRLVSLRPEGWEEKALTAAYLVASPTWAAYRLSRLVKSGPCSMGVVPSHERTTGCPQQAVIFQRGKFLLHLEPSNYSTGAFRITTQ